MIVCHILMLNNTPISLMNAAVSISNEKSDFLYVNMNVS